MKISHKNKYDKLQTLLMCYPVNYDVTKKTVNFNLMFQQYNNFINLLTKEGVDLYFLDPIYGVNQVYTRDIAFVIDDILFISKMTNEARQEEHKSIEEYIKDKDLHSYKMKNNIEGGDVIVYNQYVLVGMSKRTSLKAVEELQEYLNKSGKEYKVIQIKFDCDVMLHLDCVLNIINKDSCIASNFIYDKDKIENIFKNYYYIDNRTSLELGTNIICLGKNKVISGNKQVCKLLEDKGVTTFYINYSEIIKGGGAFTCTTLPIYRK
ncbi:dimethylarginine dimethylaminohydrolase family protein [uncultured Clostridium sp.]|uniref:dimethylarginine dimethylaminohydrolase family protein n=1 Tax=uncultured Clostridium sp. TaxID=59620 RepID=UPI00262F8EC5|nr:arginine deiminase family protein [uncultured Clostridium sp.]